MSISVLTQTAKKLWYKIQSLEGKQIDEFLFVKPDNSKATTVRLDKYIAAPWAASHVKNGQSSPVAHYQVGSGVEYEVQKLKRKTPIDEQLEDSVVAGLEPDDDVNMQMAKVIEDIITGPAGFNAAFKMSRMKMAMDVYRTGKMTFRDIAGEDMGDNYSVDFKRHADLTYTYSLTGKTVDQALIEQLKRLRVQRMPQGNVGVIMGQSWLDKLEKSTTVQEKRKANNDNVLIRSTIAPPQVAGVHGLNYVCTYRPDGCSVSFTIMTYTPDYGYIPTEGGTEELFLPDDEMLMFNIAGRSWRCNRGCKAFVSPGVARRMEGELILDSYPENDPIEEYFRAQARPFYIRGNINHTSCFKGTNF